MQEVEIKILDIDRAQVVKKVLALGGCEVFDGDIHAVYYDTPDRVIGRALGAFRLRREGRRSVLTLKAHVADEGAKIRLEKEVEVSDFGTMRTILESVGFAPWLEMFKHRTTYELPEARVEFDKYLGEYAYIPEFIEIEGSDTETVYRYAELLGFSREDCRPWDAVQLSEYYLKRP